MIAYKMILIILSIFQVINALCYPQCKYNKKYVMKCDMKCDAIPDANIFHPFLYNFLYIVKDNPKNIPEYNSDLYYEYSIQYSPACPAAKGEDDCIYILGCSWCPTIGCTYKDVADLLPIEDICYSAIGISGEPEEYHLFLFKYGRVKPPKVSR